MLRQRSNLKRCSRINAFHNFLKFFNIHIKEFFSQINLIYSTIIQFMMKCSFQCNSIFREYKRMYIKREGNTCIAKFIDSILRLKTACHANLKHLITKRTYVTNNIYSTCLTILQVDNLCLFLFNLVNHRIHFFQSLTQLFQFIIMCLLHLCRNTLNLLLILQFLGLNFLALLLQSLTLFGLLPHLLFNGTLFFLCAFALDIILIFCFNYIQIQ